MFRLIWSLTVFCALAVFLNGLTANAQNSTEAPSVGSTAASITTVESLNTTISEPTTQETNTTTTIATTTITTNTSALFTSTIAPTTAAAPSRASSSTTTTSTTASTTSTPAQAITTTIVTSTASTPLPSTTTTSGSTNTNTDPTKKNKELILYAIVGVVVVLVVILAIILTVVFCRRRQRNKQREQDMEIGNLTDTNDQRIRAEVNTGFDPNPKRSSLNSKPIPIDQLLNHVISLAETPGGFKEEFISMKVGPRYPIDASTKEYNKDKNRFMNILTYDHSRVVLTSEDNENEYMNVKDARNDYVNANYVYGYKKEKTFIAAQGPLNTTVSDFWRLVWQNNASKIVMVTNLVERGKSKCAYYWPDEGSESYGPIKVRLEKEEAFPEYIVRILELSKGRDKKTVLQFHFVAWPDEGAPTTGTSLLALQDLINNIPSNGGNNGPIVIHCSAGIGRTGTFIAVDYLRRQAEEEGVVDVLGCVDRMREDRINMVQSLEQYIYIYTTVLEAVFCGKVRWPAIEYPNEISSLVDNSFDGEETPVDKHFKVLEVLKPPSYDARCKTGKDPANANKNRSEDILPADNIRPYLTPTSASPSNYINAVLVDSLKRKNAYIVSQMPLPHTQKDLWRLVGDFRCGCIVMLNELSEDADDAIPYWPLSTEEEPIKVDPFTIKTTAVADTGNIVITQLAVLGINKKNETRVIHVRLTGWPDNRDVPSSTKPLIELYRELRDIKLLCDDFPLVLHCLYGAQKSGLVCATLSLLEALENNAYVDVFNVVKRIRRSRPQFVATLVQYKFLHLVARDFVEKRSSVKLLL